MNKKVIDIINNVNDLNFEINNEELIINFFCDNQKNMNINIVQKDNSTLVINYSSLIKNDCTVNIKSDIKGNNNKCVINVHAIAIDGLGNFNVEAKANENTLNNDIVEDLKGVNEMGSICFIPVLEVDTNEAQANHFTTIGSYDKNELFYLMSKGIPENSAINLLKKSFMYNLFSDEFIDKIGGKTYE